MNRNYLRPFFVSIVLFPVLFLVLTAAPGWSEESINAAQWNITADKLTRYEDPPSVIAEGNVVLTKTRTATREKKVKRGKSDWSSLLGEDATTTGQDGEKEVITTTETLTTIKSDWMVYDVDLGTVKSRGNILIDIGEDQLTAEEGVVDLNRETGTFQNATIVREYKDMHFEGRVIEKTGDLTYHIEDGWIITCKLKDGETPPWSFAAADAKITDGGYAFLKHATFRIKGVPVMYTPYMILPAKRQRATGFLFPSLSYSDRDGVGYEQPFFINLSPSSDITLYPYYMTERGVMAGAEFRYMLDQNDKGSFMANYLDDNLSDPNDPDNADYYQDGNYTHTNQERYWFRGKVDQDFGEWTSRFDLDVVSDRDYLTEFTSGFTGFRTSDEEFFRIFGRGFQNKTEEKRRNTARLLRSWSGMSLQGELLAINDVRRDAVKDATVSPLWKLPSVAFTGLVPLGDTTLDFSWDADYVNYWRQDGVGAHRLDLYPRLSAPLPFSSYLESTIDVGVRNTSYVIHTDEETQETEIFSEGDGDATSDVPTVVVTEPEWSDGDSENRFLFDVIAQTGTTLMRDFSVNAGTVQSLNHVFRPYVEYRFTSDNDDEEDLPQFDSVDNVADRNLITYGIDNFINIFGNRSGREYDREYAFLKIRQGYDLRSEQSEEPLTPLDIRFRLQPLQRLYLLYKTNVDVYGDGVLRYSLESGYYNTRGDTFAADYRYDKNGNINSIKASTKLNLFYNLTAGYSLERSIEHDKTVEENFSLIYKPSCWSVEFLSNYTPGDHKMLVVFRLANIGNPLGLDLPGF